jgi:hypothetical protein
MQAGKFWSETLTGRGFARFRLICSGYGPYSGLCVKPVLHAGELWSKMLAGRGFARFRLICTRTFYIPRLPGIPELIPFPKPHISLLTQSGFTSSLPGQSRVNADIIAISGRVNC